MAKKTQPLSSDKPVQKQDHPLDYKAGQDWLREEHAKAARELERGPGGKGWTYNEILRPAVEAKETFLRALVALMEKGK